MLKRIQERNADKLRRKMNGNDFFRQLARAKCKEGNRRHNCMPVHGISYLLGQLTVCK